jgi:hypothetical protein
MIYRLIKLAIEELNGENAKGSGKVVAALCGAVVIVMLLITAFSPHWLREMFRAIRLFIR